MLLIDRDEFEDLFHKQIEWGADDLIAAVDDALQDAQVVDSVQVVRCKDCKHLMFSDCYGECEKGYLGIVSPDDFCSYGERIEENG